MGAQKKKENKYRASKSEFILREEKLRDAEQNLATRLRFGREQWFQIVHSGHFTGTFLSPFPLTTQEL